MGIPKIQVVIHENASSHQCYETQKQQEGFSIPESKKEDKTKEQITLKSNQFRKYFTLMRVWDMRRK